MNNSGSQIYLAPIFIGPGIIDEQSICEPVSTGSIIYRFYDTDWMWSGKTSIGVDTIIHWPFDFLVRRSICICTIETSRSLIFR